MAILTDITTTPKTNLNWIDSLLDYGPNWNFITNDGVTFRNTLYYTFDMASGTDTSVTSATAFNSDQINAARAILNYVSQVTGISFQETSNGSSADWHFAQGNLGSLNSNYEGYTTWNSSYSYAESSVLTSFSAVAFVYLDNRTSASWYASNQAPLAGNDGYQVLLHEIGHALGLKHPFDTTSDNSATLSENLDTTSNTVMSYTWSGADKSTFQAYDVAALDWLYGKDGLGGSWGVGAAGKYWDGTNGADKFICESGDDVINGDDGIDTSVYSLGQSNYTITKTPTGYLVKANLGTDGTDTLTNVERLQFADEKIALDLAPDGKAGQAMEFIGVMAPALLDSAPIRGLIISLFDQGNTMEGLCQQALDIDLVTKASNAELANAVFHNVTGSTANQEMTNSLVGYIESHSQANFLATVAAMHINVDLVGLQQTGIEYIL